LTLRSLKALRAPAELEVTGVAPHCPIDGQKLSKNRGNLFGLSIPSVELSPPALA
jgi:hypothetical protein